MVRVEKLQFRNIRYLLYYPKNYEEGKKYPVFFHLHGAGSRGNDFKEFEGSLILNILEKGDSPLSNGFCVFPQCHEDTWYSFFSDLIDFATYIHDSPFCDQEQFNGSGISMGSYGLYSLIQCAPHLFHKVIICCGGGMYWNSIRMKGISYRIFHGEQDKAVYVEEAYRMYDRLKEACIDVTLKIYPECDHNCWDKTYGNYDNLLWIMTK